MTGGLARSSCQWSSSSRSCNLSRSYTSDISTFSSGEIDSSGFARASGFTRSSGFARSSGSSVDVGIEAVPIGAKILTIGLFADIDEGLRAIEDKSAKGS